MASKEEVENLFNCTRSPDLPYEQRQNIDKILLDLTNQASFFPILFEISTEGKEYLSKMALVFLKKTIDAIYSHLSNDEKSFVKSHVMQLIFSVNDYSLAIDCLNSILFVDDLENPQEFFSFIQNKINTHPLQSITLLSVVLKFTSEEFISSNFPLLYNFVQIGLTSEQLIGPSVEILIILYPFLATHQDMASCLTKISEFACQSFGKPYFNSIWKIVALLCHDKAMPESLILPIFQYLLQNVQNPQIEVISLTQSLLSISNYFSLFNVEMITALLDATFFLAFRYFCESFTLPNDPLTLLEIILTKLPKLNIYPMIKERVISILSQPDDMKYPTAICSLGFVVSYTPDIALKDIQFLISTLQNALNQNNELLNASVCFVLNQFNESFKSYVPEFLPKIVPFLANPNDELRKNANDAIHNFCQLIDTKIPDFFQAIWSIKNNIPNDDIPGFMPYIATAIEKTENFGDAEIDEIISTIEPIFLNPQQSNIDPAYFLVIISSLVSQVDSLIDDLLPITIPILDRYVINYKECTNDDVLGYCLIYIGDIIKTFPEKSNELLNYVISSQLIANDSTKSDRIVIEALKTSSITAKYMENHEMAEALQPICCKVLSFEDEDLNLIPTGVLCSLYIAKLLNEESSKQLFDQLFTFCMNSKDCPSVAEATRPLIKLIKHATNTNLQQFLTDAYQLIECFIQGNLPSNDFPPLSGQCDLIYMKNFAFLIGQVIRYPHPFVDQLCLFIISVLNSPNEAALFSYIGAFSDGIKFNTIKPEFIQQFFIKVPDLIQNHSSDPDSQQNISFLFNILLQVHPELINVVQPFIQNIWQWLQYGQQQMGGYELLVSNAASFFLTLFANNYPINEVILLASLKEIPPFDRLETSTMLNNVIKILDTKQINEQIIEQISFGFAEVLLMKNSEIQERRISQELFMLVTQKFRNIIQAFPQVYNRIQIKYRKSKAKIQKLNKVI